jgi:putative ABC transport system permease protein
MLRNYWRIARRIIARNKLYTLINVLGLALGICGCVILFLITSYEFSFDRHHPDGDRIYRIVGMMTRSSGEERFLNSPFDDVAGIRTQIPGFEAKGAIYEYGGKIAIPQKDQKPKQFDNRIHGQHMSTAVFTWPEYFDVFSYQWLEGNAQSLDQPGHVVLTENRARLYFGNIPLPRIIGKTVIYDDSLPVNVSGIVRDYSGNTDLGWTDFLSITTATTSFLNTTLPKADWTILQPHRSMAFVKLQKDVTPAQIDARLAAYLHDHIKHDNPGAHLSMYLQPLANLHFTPDFHRGDDGDGWDKAYLPTLYTLTIVAIFILLIAAVNFINLSTAQSLTRNKEVGVRRVMGSNKTQIRLQHLTETLVITLASVILAILLINPVMALFRDYIPKSLEFHLFGLDTLGFLAGMTILTTLLAGFYPAWVLSASNPVLTLKGTPGPLPTQRPILRRALIVFQFTISLFFIVCALTIGKQIGYMKNADKGFDTDRVLSISDWNNAPEKLQVFANAIKSLPGVEKAIFQGTAPMGFAQNIESYSFQPAGNEFHDLSAHIGNEEYIPFYHMKLVAGRNVHHSDSLRELIINETLAAQLGCRTPQEALGRRLYAYAPPGQPRKSFPIVGVVKDFHVSDFHTAIPPVVIENVPRRRAGIAVRITADEQDARAVKAITTAIEQVWKKQFPDRPFQANLLNEGIGWLFDQEKKTAWLVDMATAVTIGISCLGLFGLGLFTTRRRAREIGIRKVLGASVSGITTMLSRDFALLIGIAFCVATPLAWFAAHRWLNDFVFRTTLNWWLFAIAGLAALSIAMLTIAVQAVRAAKANPIDSLRAE